MFDLDEDFKGDGQESKPFVIRDKVIEKFCEYWSTLELKSLIDTGGFASTSCVLLLRHFTDVQRSELTNQEKLAHILYEIVGSKFLRKRDVLGLILKTIEQKSPDKWSHILKLIQEFQSDNSLSTPVQIAMLKRNPKWLSFLAGLLDFPESCAVYEEKVKPPSRENIFPVTRLNPLYDFQYILSRNIKEMLEGKTEEKHAIVAIPTGAGKTRLMVETIVDWLNEKKSGKNFIIWIAQSKELCEQAITTFKEVFHDKGRLESLTIHRFFDDNNAIPSIYDSGIIVANISMLYTHINELEEFGPRTGLIVIDEVHRSTSKMYIAFYKKMGFDLRRNRPKDKPENQHKIVLIGLTATPFRGSTFDSPDDEEDSKETETEKLHRFYHNNILLPIIPDSELQQNNKEPHAVIEIEKEIHLGDWIRISGSRSYDEDGRITKYKWTFYEKDGEEFDSRTGETIPFRFDNQGPVKIRLTVNDDEGTESFTEETVNIIPKRESKKLEIKENMQLIHKSLVAKQILSEVYQRVIKLESEDELSLNQEDKDALKKNVEFTDYILQKIGENKTRNIRTINEIQKLIDEGKRSILFFAASVAHAQDMSIVLNSMGIESRYVIGDMESFDRYDAIEKFKKQEVTVLCNYGVLTHGFDAPLIDVIIVARPTLSHLLYNQMVGRGMRGPKNGGTLDCVLVDFEDNILIRTLREVGIEKDLVWLDFKPMWRSSQVIEEKPIEIPKPTKILPQKNFDFELQLKDIETLCPHCKKTKALGYHELKEKFGFTSGRIGKSNPFGIQSWCKLCRIKQLEEIKKSKLKPEVQTVSKKTVNELITFVESEMKMQSTYQPLMLITLLIKGPLKKFEIATFLAKGNYSNNYYDFMNVPVYDVLTSRNIVTYDKVQGVYKINAELETKEKSDLIHALETKLHSYIESRKKSLKLKALEHFENLCEELGYPPTRRIYQESDPPVGLQFFKENYNTFENFQKQQGKIVLDNPILREKLFDQYFDAYQKLKRLLKIEEVDKYGEFTPGDYAECFSNFDAFYYVVEPIVKKLEKIKPIDADTLKLDYFELRKKLSSPPTFDQIRMKSDIGIEYYIKEFGTYGKFKDEVAIEDEIIIAKKIVKSEFDELKRRLGNFVPTYEMMKKYSTITKHVDFILQLYGTYEKFLESINEKEPRINKALINQKKSELKNRFERKKNSLGDIEALKTLELDEILYQQWFNSTTQFLKEEFPFLLSIYNSQIISENDKVLKKSQDKLKIDLYNVPEIKRKDRFISTSLKLKSAKKSSDFYRRPIDGWTECPKCKNPDLIPVGKWRRICTSCNWMG